MATKATPQATNPNNAFFQIGSGLDECDDGFDLPPVSLTVSAEFISSRVQIPVCGCFEMLEGLVKIVRGAADEIFILEAFDMMGLDGNDTVHVLESAGDKEEWFLGNDKAKLLE